MLKIYDKKHNAIGRIVKYKDCKIESDLSTADKTLSFTYMANTHNLENEYYIQTKDDEYVVKEVNETSDGFPGIVAALNMEDLEGKSWEIFSVTDTTIDAAARLVLTGTGWTIGTCNVTKKRNAGMVHVSSREVIQNLCTAFMCEVKFDTINKKISFYEKRGDDKGVYFLSGLNLKKLTKKSTSYDYYTQIIPIGSNGLTIEKENNGKNYLENYQYSDKKLQYIWKDESYTDARALMEDAELKLEDISKPEKSFSANVRDLAAQKEEYKILSYQIGDTITIIDKYTKTREKQRITKLTEYPQEPGKNTCELANTSLTFTEMQDKVQAAADIINYTVAGDGRYTGTINVSDILNFENGLSGSSTIGEINGNIASLDGDLSKLSLTVGEIETNYIKAETADLEYAKIDLANIKTACITSAMIETEAVGTSQIANGSITDAKIVELTANKINAGTLSVERLEIRGSDKSIVYAINNISGALQAQNVDTLNGEILTPRTITADKIVANAITAREIATKTITANEIVSHSIDSELLTTKNIVGVSGWINLHEGTFNYGSGKFEWDGTNLTVRGSGEFSGVVSASRLTATDTGTISCWNFNSNAIYYGASTYGSTGGMYFGISGLSISDKFRINANGATTIITPCDEYGFPSGDANFVLKDEWDRFSTSIYAGRIYIDGLDARTVIDAGGMSMQTEIGGENFLSIGSNSIQTSVELIVDNRIITTQTLTASGGIELGPYGAYIYPENNDGNIYFRYKKSANAGYSYDSVKNMRNLIDGKLSQDGGTIYGNLKVNEILNFQDWTGTTSRRPVASGATDKKRVAYVASSASAFIIGAQFGSSDYSEKNISVSSSDIRLKTNVRDSEISALEVIKSIKIREFDWIDGREDFHQEIGFVADELEAIDKKLAIGGGSTEDGYMNVKSVNDFYLSGYVVKGMQEIVEIEEEHGERLISNQTRIENLEEKLLLAYDRIAKLEEANQLLQASA